MNSNVKSLFRLWLSEFLDIWESVCNNPDWEQVHFLRNFDYEF